MSIVICHHYNKNRHTTVYNQPKKVIVKPKVTNDTLFYHITKVNKHGVFGTGIFVKSNTFNTQKQLYINGQLLWFKNDQIKQMTKRKLKRKKED